ncbi:hypothetical protein QBC41DRAFT_313642 [Cercophora samala]|uniref:Uncharacterized protein n=1 Tax=Cercophora samala TaxID=330535 RepID=A0AA39ZK76_9PEZI|nr:hypothetical protein QBC41DRAFT_313642 [Cercophora samala]
MTTLETRNQALFTSHLISNHHRDNLSSSSSPFILSTRYFLTSFNNMESTSLAAAVNLNGIAIHLGHYLCSVIAFLQLPTDVAWRRTVSSLQAANTATFTALNLYVQLYCNLVLQSINNSWNSIMSSVHQASTTTSTAVLTVVESVKVSIGLGLNYLLDTATSATKAATSLFVDYLPTIAVGFYSDMRKEMTMQHVKSMNIVLFVSSLVWFYLRRCVDLDASSSPVRKGQVAGTRKWRRRFQVVLRELASLLVLGSLLSYVAMPDWTTATTISALSTAIDRLTCLFSMAVERLEPIHTAVGREITRHHLGKLAEDCLARLPPLVKRLEPLYAAVGGESTKLHVIKFAENWFARLPPLPHWHQWQSMSRDVGIGVLTPIAFGGPSPSPSPISLASNLSSERVKSLFSPTGLSESALSYQGEAMMIVPFLTYVIAAWDLVMLVRRRQKGSKNERRRKLGEEKGGTYIDT